MTGASPCSQAAPRTTVTLRSALGSQILVPGDDVLASATPNPVTGCGCQRFPGKSGASRGTLVLNPPAKIVAVIGLGIDPHRHRTSAHVMVLGLDELIDLG